MTGRTSMGLQPSLSAAEKDEGYYWDNVRFLVEGIIFKLPRYQFTVGSEHFAKTYLQDVPRCLTPDADPDDEWDSMDVTDAPRVRISTAGAVHLEGVTAAQFRTFLKLLFPIHSTTTTLTLARAEWLTVLTLSTRWHFLELRKLAMEHLDSQIQVAHAVGMITVGRAEYVSKWVEGGYEKLVVKKEAISEEESEQVGWRTAVKLYIVRHKLAGTEKNMKSGKAREEIQRAFSDELATLKGQERERRTREEIRIEEDQENLKLRQEEERNMKEEEAQRLIADAARRAKEEVLETERAKEEERRGGEERRRDEQKRTEERKIEEERRQEERQRTEAQKIEEDGNLDSEQMRGWKKAKKKAKKAMAKQAEREALGRGTSSNLATSTGRDGKQGQDDQENDATESDVSGINAGERDDQAQEQKYNEESAAAEENAAAEKRRREAEREALVQQKLEEELEMIMADTKRREEERKTAERKRQEEEKEAAERRRQEERRAARREEQRQAAALSLRKQQAEAAWAARAQPPKTLMAGFIERVLPHAQEPAVSEKATWEASFRTPFGTSRAS